MSTIIDGSSGITTPGLVNSGNETVSGTLTASGFNAASTFGFKNRIINGAMQIDQRNAGASVTVSGGYTLDRWYVNESSDAVLATQQVSDAPSGFINSLKITVTTADTSIAANQWSRIYQAIEGLNFADLAWGTTNAQPITISFWVKSSLTGTFGGALQNGSVNRSYTFTYNISAANTWEYKTVTIAGDITGTWATNNTVGVYVYFDLGTGTDYQQAAGSWQAANKFAPTSYVAVISTLNATWQITGVQLEKGSTATSFDYRPYGTELQLCQRYYQTTMTATGVGQSSTAIGALFTLGVSMRATPSISTTGALVLTDTYALDVVQSSGASAIYGGNSNAVYCQLTNFTGLTTGRPYVSRLSNTNVLACSAEL